MTGMPTFADRLLQKIREHSPLCVGIDPSAALLKSCGLPDSAEGALEFGERVLEAADFRIAVLKPQSAFFERFGSAGLRALEALVQLARKREVLVLVDGTRAGEIVARLAREHDVTADQQLTLPLLDGALVRLRVPGNRSLESLLAALSTDPDVQLAQPNYDYRASKKPAAAKADGPHYAG